MIQDRAGEIEQANRRSHDLHALEMQIREMVSHAQGFLITGSDRAALLYRAAASKVARELVQEKRDDGFIRAALQGMNRVADKIFSLPFATGNMEGPILMEELNGLLGRLSDHLRAQHIAMDQDVNRSMQAVATLRLDMRNDFLLALVVLLLLLLAVSIHLYRRVVRPLTRLQQEVTRIGDGDFSPVCPDFGDNELGELSRALNNMGAALTERDRALEQAKSVAAHQEKMHALGLMTASIAHEVGNPLSAAIVSLDVCRAKSAAGQWRQVGGYLDVALQELRRTENIIRSVLDFGRCSSDDSAIVDPRSVVEGALRLVRLSRNARSMRFVVMLTEEMPEVLGNEDMLAQVLVNLLLNAVDASDDGATVEISGGMVDAMAFVDVIDHGSGIPEQLCNQIFSPMFSTKPKGQGTGLGLAISRDLMRRMGGDLVLAENSDHGCRFRMLLPVVAHGGGNHAVTTG